MNINIDININIGIVISIIIGIASRRSGIENVIWVQI